MDTIIYGILLTVIAILVGFIIRKSKREGWDKRIQDKIDDYYFLFDICGEVIKKIDSQLYDEMDDVLKALDDLYQKENVSKDDIQLIIDQAQDVFDRAVELYHNQVKE